MATNNKTSLSWHAPEFRHYEKSAGWYVTLIAISIIVVGFFVIQRDIFAAVTMGIIAVLVAFFSRHKPDTVEIELNTKGVKFGNISFPYKQIKYFWVVHNDNHKTLIFHTSTLVNNTVIIELEDQEPEKIRNFLVSYVPEHEEVHETFAQRLMHKFKF